MDGLHSLRIHTLHFAACSQGERVATVDLSRVLKNLGAICVSARGFSLAQVLRSALVVVAGINAQIAVQSASPRDPARCVCFRCRAVSQKDELAWGPNATFRFPLHGALPSFESSRGSRSSLCDRIDLLGA